MNIGVFRIDDRLIHGQIVTAWLAYADAKQIVVADDKAAKDEFSQTLLKMATPASVHLQILSLDQAIEYHESGSDDKRTLLLVRGPKEASYLVKNGLIPNSINVGNLNMKKGKSKILDNLWVDDGDVNGFYEIAENGVELEYRTIPSDRSQNVVKLLKKY